MPASSQTEHKSANRRAFKHYLRTGQRLTSAEWCARFERKFNPYHDENGRFTSPPGMTVSYDRGGGRSPADLPSPASGTLRSRSSSSRPNWQSRRTGRDPAAPASASAGPSASGNGFRSDFVRGAVGEQTANAYSYFELNKRQAYLDGLRKEAGPSPSEEVLADLADFQHRLNADRARLDEMSRIADANVREILRAGLMPFDVAVGSVNIATGNGEFRDYVAVAGVLPVGIALNRVGKLATVETELLAGAFEELPIKIGYHRHHVPPRSVSPYHPDKGPALYITAEHHAETGSYATFPGSNTYRQIQKELIDNGDFAKAIQMDFDELRYKFGNEYDESIRQIIKKFDLKGVK